MDTLLDTVSIGIGLIIGLISGFILAILAKEVWIQRKISRLESINTDLEDEIESLRNRLNGRAGLDAKKDKAERLEKIMVEFAIAMKQPNANIAEVIKQTALANPDIALSLARKGLKI